MPKSPQLATLSALALVLAAGCAKSPFEQERADALRRIAGVTEDRQRAPFGEQPPETRTTAPQSSIDLGFSQERLDELATMAGATSYRGVKPDTGPGLFGDDTPVVTITLDDAIRLAVQNNLNLRSAAFLPAISLEALDAADAAFDWVFFTGVEWRSVDQPQSLRVIGNTPVGSGALVNESVRWNTGVRKPLRQGGTFDVAANLTYINDRTPGTSLSPDPSRAAVLEFGLNQPLLRGFGSDSAEAEVRLAENQTRRAALVTKSELLTLVREVERGFQNLSRAHHALLIQQRLLERGVETRDVLAGRLEFDVRPAEFSDARARVEARRANLIRFQRILRQRSDELKALLDSEQFPLAGEELLLPPANVDASPIDFNLLDSITSALQNRPELQLALLNIDDAAIRQRFADNARLPLLDLNLRAALAGLDDSFGDAFGDIADSDYVDYIAGLQFEQTIGNRGPEAVFRVRRLERLQSVLDYATQVRNSVLLVKSSLRTVVTSYALIEQTRISRIAAAENLRTLLVEEQTLRGLTPDFLNLKLNRQEALAQAELEESGAIIDYKIALAELYDAMGILLDKRGISFVAPTADELLERGTEWEPRTRPDGSQSRPAGR